MKALVFKGPGRKAWEERPRPCIQDAGDAVVRISVTTICGTDLHILGGDVPSVEAGRVLGHEGVGVVEEVGTSVTKFRAGDRVLISCITADGTCDSCRVGMYSHCEHGGWVLGNTIDGTQAEYVRIPFADTSLHRAPCELDDDVLAMLSDILPTAFECGVLNGHVSPGETIAIIGAGPIGLAALLTAQLYSPCRIIMVDPDSSRLEVAERLGASRTVRGEGSEAVTSVMKMTAGKGVDVAIEAVGVPGSFDICQSILAPGGRLANIGVYGTSVALRMDRLWSHNITLTTRLVDTVTTPMLLRMLISGQLDPRPLITHRFRLGEIEHAYETFGNAAREGALKVALTND